MTTLKIFNKKITVPEKKWLRILIGVGMILGGFLGFLPIVGFWMLPLGIIILSIDIPVVRRFRRWIMVKWVRWRQSKNA